MSRKFPENSYELRWQRSRPPNWQPLTDDAEASTSQPSTPPPKPSPDRYWRVPRAAPASPADRPARTPDVGSRSPHALRSGEPLRSSLASPLNTSSPHRKSLVERNATNSYAKLLDVEYKVLSRSPVKRSPPPRPSSALPRVLAASNSSTGPPRPRSPQLQRPAFAEPDPSSSSSLQRSMDGPSSPHSVFLTRAQSPATTAREVASSPVPSTEQKRKRLFKSTPVLASQNITFLGPGVPITRGVAGYKQLSKYLKGDVTLKELDEDWMVTRESRAYDDMEAACQDIHDEVNTRLDEINSVLTTDMRKAQLMRNPLSVDAEEEEYKRWEPLWKLPPEQPKRIVKAARAVSVFRLQSDKELLLPLSPRETNFASREEELSIRLARKVRGFAEKWARKALPMRNIGAGADCEVDFEGRGGGPRLDKTLREDLAISATDYPEHKYFILQEQRGDRHIDKERHVLDLSHAKVGPKDFADVVHLIERHGSLAHIVLRNNNLDDRCVAQLCRVLCTVKDIKTLDLAENLNVGVNAATYLSLIHAPNELGKLVKNLTTHKQWRTEKVMPSHLVSLTLTGTSIGDEGAAILLSSLANNRSLEHIDLSRCQVADTAAKALHVSFQSNTRLTLLNLSWNCITAEGVAHLAQTVGTSGVRHLDLSHNALGDLGGSYMLQALIDPSVGLESLNLSGNKVAEQSMIVFREAMTINTNLKELILDENPLGKWGGKLVMEAVALTKSLQYVSLKRCHFPELVKGSRPMFDRHNPNGDYVLQLDIPAERQICVELVRVRISAPFQIEKVWKDPRVNGQRLQIRTVDDWEKDLSLIPPKGEFAVTLNLETLPPPPPVEVHEPVVDTANRAIAEDGIEDQWKVSVLEIMLMGTHVYTRHVLRLLRHFQWPSEKATAVVLLYSKMTNPEQLYEVLSTLEPSVQQAVCSHLGLFSLFNYQNLTGSYTFDLSKHVDYNIARQLLMDTLQEGLWRVDPLRGINWRNATLNGAKMTREVLLELDTFEFPIRGKLQMDYVVQCPPDLHDPAGCKVHVDYPLENSGAKKKKGKEGGVASRACLFKQPEAMPEPMDIAAFQDLVKRVRSVQLRFRPSKKLQSDQEQWVQQKLDRRVATTAKPGRRGSRWDTTKVSMLTSADWVQITDGNRPADKEDVMGLSTALLKQMVSGKGTTKYEERGVDMQEQQPQQDKAKEEGVAAEEAEDPDLKGLRNFNFVGYGGANDKKRKKKKNDKKKKKKKEKEPEVVDAGPVDPHTGLELTRAQLMDNKKRNIALSYSMHQLLRIHAAKHYITSTQLIALLWGLDDSGMDGGGPDGDPKQRTRVNVFVTYYQRVVDRKNFSDVLRVLPPEEQVAVQQRLGPLNLLDIQRPYGIQYSLQLTDPEDKLVARMLSKVAIRNTADISSWEDLKINGKAFFVKEDANMFTTITVSCGCDLGLPALVEFRFKGSDGAMQASAAVLIQSSWKRMEGRRLFRRMKDAVKTIGSAWRASKLHRMKMTPSMKYFQAVHDEMKEWKMDDSIFRDRRFESDSEAFFDTKLVYEARFEADWMKLAKGKRMEHTVGVVCSKKNFVFNRAAMIARIKDTLREHHHLLCVIFRFYTTNDEVVGRFSFTLDCFNRFVRDFELADNKSSHYKKRDFYSIFAKTGREVSGENYDPKPTDTESRTFLRHDFLECVFRMAIARYTLERGEDALDDALQLFVDNVLFPRLNREMLFRANEFRAERLYKEEVSTFLMEHYQFLAACFQAFRMERFKQMGKAVTALQRLKSLSGGSPLVASPSPSKEGSGEAAGPALLPHEVDELERQEAAARKHKADLEAAASANSILHSAEDMLSADPGKRNQKRHSILQRRARKLNMSLANWIKFVGTAGLVGAHTGITRLHVKMAFMWSQMAIVDEDEDEDRANTITFIDFIEALGFLAEVLSPPEVEEMRVHLGIEAEGYMPHTPWFKWYHKARKASHEGEEVKCIRRPSGELDAFKTHTLKFKLEVLLEIIVNELLEKHSSCTTEQELTVKLNQIAREQNEKAGLKLGF